jgi:predicted XRE-type DNA-binding protein
MNMAKWEKVNRRAEQAKAAAGLPQRRIDGEIHAFKLAEIRRARSLTQREVAEAMGVSGPRVSDVERGRLDVVSVSVLRSYVEALGGRLRVTAEFGDASFQVT